VRAWQPLPVQVWQPLPVQVWQPLPVQVWQPASVQVWQLLPVKASRPVPVQVWQLLPVQRLPSGTRGGTVCACRPDWPGIRPPPPTRRKPGLAEAHWALTPRV